MSHCVGSLPRHGIKADKDSEGVALMKKAGAIPLLVSNTPELCLSWETTNLVTGRTLNPYNFLRTSGGSSGGEVTNRMLVSNGYWSSSLWNLNISNTLHSSSMLMFIIPACSTWIYLPSLNLDLKRHWWIRLSVMIISVTYSTLDCREYKLQNGEHTQQHHFNKDN